MWSLLWPLFHRSAWEDPTTVLADTSRGGAALATVRSVGVGSDNHYGSGVDSPAPALVYVRLIGVGSTIKGDGEHEWLGNCSGLCSILRVGLS